MKKLLFFLVISIVWGKSSAQTSLASLSSEMILVEGGSMDIQGRLVTLPTFYCSKFEVTQRLFEEIMGFNPVIKPALVHPLKPVEYRDSGNTGKWRAYLIFCNELSKKTNLPIRYYKDPELVIPITLNDIDSLFDIYEDPVSRGYRLPISVEWEFAARGGNKTQNFIYSGSNELSEVGWIHGPGGLLHLVGLLKPNELGIYDMTGNEYELVFDTFKIYGGINLECNVVWDGAGKNPECRSCTYRLDGNSGRCLNTARTYVTSWEIGFRLFKDAK